MNKKHFRKFRNVFSLCVTGNYIQIPSSFKEVERMCEEWQSVPGITDQVEYLRLHSQVNIIRITPTLFTSTWKCLDRLC